MCVPLWLFFALCVCVCVCPYTPQSQSSERHRLRSVRSSSYSRTQSGFLCVAAATKEGGDGDAAVVVVVVVASVAMRIEIESECMRCADCGEGLIPREPEIRELLAHSHVHSAHGAALPKLAFNRTCVLCKSCEHPSITFDSQPVDRADLIVDFSVRFISTFFFQCQQSEQTHLYSSYVDLSLALF